MNVQRSSPQKKGPARAATSRSGTPFTFHPMVHDALLCLAIAVLILFVYRGYIIEGKVDVSPDTVSQGAPIDKFVDEFSATDNTTPLWYPYIFSGMPFQASGSYQSLQYSFETVIMTLLPDSLYFAMHGRFFFHLLLGTLSMYFLGRAVSLNRGAAFIAAIAFAFTTHMMATGHANRFICYNHIPLIFLATYRLFERRHWLYAVLLAGAFGSQLGAFHPQIAFYTAFMIGLYALYVSVLDLYDKKPVSSLLKACGLFAGAVVVAGAMAAVLVLPMQEYTQFSARNLSVGGSNVNVPFATSWSFPPIETLTFIIPSFAGFGGDTYWGEMPFTDFPNYLGVVVVLLAVLGLVLQRNRLTIFLGITALLTLLIACGSYVPPVSYIMLHILPFFGKFRAPVLMLILLQFAFALLAGFGVNNLVHRLTSPQTSPKWLVKPLIVTVGGALALTLILALSGSSFQSLMNGIYHQADVAHSGRQSIVSDVNVHAQLNAMRFELLMNDLFKTALFLGAATVMVLLFITRKIGSHLFLSSLAILVTLDLLTVAGKVIHPEFMPGRVASYYTERESVIVKTLEQDPDLFRIFPVDEPSSNEYGYFNIPSIGGYHAAKIGIYQELMDKVGFNALPVLNMLNTKYLISRRPLSGGPLAPIIESDKGNLYLNAAALPRAFLVDSLKVMTDNNAILQEMKSPVFNPAQYAIVEKTVSAQLGPKGTSTAEVTTHTPHRIDVKVNSTASCLLVLSEIYYPAGWTATIDGSPTEIYKTNYVLRSVVIPAGQHTVTFQFAPKSFTIGLLVSQITSGLVLFVLIGAAALRIRQKSIATKAVER